MSYDVVPNEDLILIEVYKHPEFDGYLNGWYEDILSERTRQFFRVRRFPFAEFLRYLF